MTTIEKLNTLAIACTGGYQLQVNQHQVSKTKLGRGKHSQPRNEWIKDAAEYLRRMGKTTESTYRDNILQAKEIYNQIVKSNQVIELYLYTDTQIGTFHIVHYDIALAVDEAWDIMKLFGKVE